MEGARAVLRSRGADDAASSGGRGSRARLAPARRSPGESEPGRIRHPVAWADRSILALDEVLTSFSRAAPRQAKVVELRYFGGLTEEEIEAAMDISPRTIRRDW